MVDQQVQELNRQIIEFSAKIGGLVSTVTNLNQNWERNDRDAKEGRGRLHAKVDEMKDKLVELAGRVDHIAEEFAAIRPQIEMVKAERHEAIGSKKATAAIWGALFMLAGSAGAIAEKLLELFWPPKH